MTRHGISMDDKQIEMWGTVPRSFYAKQTDSSGRLDTKDWDKVRNAKNSSSLRKLLL